MLSDDSDLERAAQHFATALAQGGLTILEVLVTHRVFRAVEGKLRERFPSPGWLRTQYEQAAAQREQTARAGEPERSSEKLRRSVEKLADVTASGVRYEGAKRVAEDFPTAAVVLSGALLAVGTVAVAAWAISASARKVRP